MILFWRPEQTSVVEQTESQRVIVLVDHSKSMSTVDAQPFNPAESPVPSSRLSVADAFAKSPAWDELDSRWDLVVKDVFVDDVNQSNLGAAVGQLGFDDSASCVVISDGDWNAGESPLGVVQEKTLQAGQRFALHTITVGSDQRLPDLELFGVSCPTVAIEGKPLRIPYTIANWFPESKAVTVRLAVDGEAVEETSITIAAGARHDGTLHWMANGEGNHQAEVSVDQFSGESDLTNNGSQHQVDVRPESLRVLIVESEPRWEFRYLRNALIRDPGVEVNSLLFHPSLEGVGGGGDDYLAEFPASVSELSEYDVIFLGDVGLSEGQLTEDQCDLIAGTVSQQATGLVLMPGREMRQSSLGSSPLETLVPVIYEDLQKSGQATTTSSQDQGNRLALTETGRASLLTQLADQPSDNWKLWQSLPGFYWNAPVQRAKSGGEVLAVHADAANEFGRVPLLVTRRFGAGKILWMGTDSAWRWRMGVEDKYHYRFWGQVIRWMAYGRNMAVGESMRLIYQPEQPIVSSPVSLRASVMTEEGEPASEPSVELFIRDPSGQSSTITLNHSEGDWGVYVGEAVFSQIGTHQLTLHHPSEDKTLNAEVAVKGRAVEAVGRPVRIDVMREMARLGQGRAFATSELSDLIQTLNNQVARNVKTQTIRLWQHPIVLLGMIGGLSLFWILRKWAGVL
ncbi:hypothetical protein LOC67_04060 [Stieleria sp. JC731]|uniref:CARDB domain-containing protein n=1 Tax=Stieleria sp. JC731 TaxID=2894195 RepID=UPI001E57685B|nr:CARDB domain-containing protein [Stieleria sp. JC731]MCC9599725.1 hypothetical protein [Stieleria sp. JC731]